MIKPKANEVRKPTKTISGITPVAVMLPPRDCRHGTCLYCPSLNVPQSYTPKSPVVMRASEIKYNSYEQTRARIKAFEVMNHPTDKIELIIMGGTFLEYPKKFQYEFVKGCYDALNEQIGNLPQTKKGNFRNEKKSKTLEQAQRKNEKAKHRCVALCVETRPDECVKYIKRMREFGVTRVELGVQMPDNKIYEKIKRGHKVKDVAEATKALREAGFKIGYHIMPGLPGSNPKKDLELFKKLFSDERFKPDQLKIYPCQVIKGSKLEEEFWKKKYKPYTKEQIEKLLIAMMKAVPRYCRVMRIMREIPPDYLVSGTTRIDLRKDVEEKLRRENKKIRQKTKPLANSSLTSQIKEIRFREVGFVKDNELDHNLKLKVTKYRASKGEEYFLEIVNAEDILFGLLRLRISDGKSMIREVHVYGQSLKLGEKGKTSQHLGLGKWLMAEAEKIVEKSKCKKIFVISGIGVREYYRKLGYELEESYMVKFL